MRRVQLARERKDDIKCADLLLKAYMGSGGGKLRHEGMPDVEVRAASMRHSISAHSSHLGSKRQYLMDGKSLGALYANGTARRMKIKLTRDDGSVSSRKQEWKECWKVSGRVPRIRRPYVFTVCRDNSGWRLYDFSMDDI